MNIGYARVSTPSQNLALQTDALMLASCELIFEDKMSGSRHQRPGLDKALEMCRKGDCLIVWKLDRLGRSTRNLIETVQTLQDRGVQFRSLSDGLDTSTPQGRLFLNISACFAQMEVDLLVERTKAGQAAARAAGKPIGRKPVMTESKQKAAGRLLAGGIPVKDIAKDLGVSVPSLYRWMAKKVTSSSP
jgi:DNA invertase Pin-like site-specific DNA recombinase